MKSKIKQQTIQQPITVEEEEIQQEEVIIEDVKPKRQISEQQLLNLAKARERAKERKKELAQLNSKSKGLKEEKLRKDAEEFDRLLEEKERYRKDEEKKLKQQELEEALEKIEHEKKVVDKPKRKVKKIIYEPNSDEEEEEEEVVVVKAKPKPKPKPPSYTELTNMSVEKQIKDRLQQEKIECFFNQLTGKKY
jgi:multidrug efflux pump subunit AcrA (membrane-fusion protein)